MADLTKEEQDDLNEWHDQMADAIADVLPDLPDGYTYQIKTRSFQHGDKVSVVIGAKSRLIDDLDPPDNGHDPWAGDPSGWWAEFFAGEDDTD